MVEDLIPETRVVFPAAAAMSSVQLANIKPILVIDEKGKLITVAKKRGEKLALRELRRDIRSRIRYGKQVHSSCGRKAETGDPWKKCWQP